MMKTRVHVEVPAMRLCFVLLITLALAACATRAPPLDREALSAGLRAAEESFARSMAERDFAAFARHVSEDAVFFSGEEVLRGKAEILSRWQPLFEGPDPPFAWAPARAEVSGDGQMGYTEGPVTMPDGRVEFRFQSTWRRQPDGGWLVVFDRGSRICPEPGSP